MNGFTGKEEKFISALVAGKTYIQAYKGAYDCAQSGEETIRVRASELQKKPKIKNEIERRKAKINEAVQEHRVWDKEQALNALKFIIIASQEATRHEHIVTNNDGTEETHVEYNPAAARAATMAIEQANKMLGLNEPEKTQIDAKITVEMPDFDDYAD